MQFLLGCYKGFIGFLGESYVAEDSCSDEWSDGFYLNKSKITDG